MYNNETMQSINDWYKDVDLKLRLEEEVKKKLIKESKQALARAIKNSSAKHDIKQIFSISYCDNDVVDFYKKTNKILFDYAKGNRNISLPKPFILQNSVCLVESDDNEAGFFSVEEVDDIKESTRYILNYEELNQELEYLLDMLGLLRTKMTTDKKGSGCQSRLDDYIRVAKELAHEADILCCLEWTEGLHHYITNLLHTNQKSRRVYCVQALDYIILYVTLYSKQMI